MQIRRADATDEEALAHIRRSAILTLAVPAMSVEQAETWAAQAPADRIAQAIRDHEVWVAVEGTAIGWVEVDRDRVAALYVSPRAPVEGSARPCSHTPKPLSCALATRLPVSSPAPTRSTSTSAGATFDAARQMLREPIRCAKI